MKKTFFIFIVFFSSFMFAQSEYISAYKDGFADALCYNRENYCQRRAPYDKDIPLPSYNEKSDFATGFVKGMIAGFKYRNTEAGTNYDFSDYMEKIVARKIESRRRAVQNYENYLDEDLRRRNPRPTDARQAEIYDMIMSNNL